MKHLIILGAGTGGTLVANRMVERLDARHWTVTVVDPEVTHLYQPGLLALPFGSHDESELQRPRGATLDPRITWHTRSVWAVDLDARTVTLDDDSALAWDLLVIATGSGASPERTEGLLGAGWQRNVFDFYTLDGALKLRDALARFEAGRLVVDVVRTPIKGVTAPLEFCFLADRFFEHRGQRSNVELTLVVPGDGVFPGDVAARRLHDMLTARGVRVVTGFPCAAVDGAARRLRSADGRALDFDLLVTIPAHAGAAYVKRSGLGDADGFVPADARSLVAHESERVFVLGDAAALPATKVSSVVHFEAETLVDNLLRATEGRGLVGTFDGHANCFVETGDGKAVLLDYNYDTEPAQGGRYPLPGVGPFTVLEDTRINRQGKAAYRWMYWKALLPGKPIPVPTRLSGKPAEAGED